MPGAGPVVQSPPEPAKMRLSWLLEPVEDPKGQIILKLNTLKLLEPVKSL